jgi:hypothetical protein
MGHWQALDQSQRERMAPSETFVHDWDPFEIQLDNLKYLQVCGASQGRVQLVRWLTCAGSCSG